MPRKAKTPAVSTSNNPNLVRPQEFTIPYFDEAQYRVDRGMQWIKLDHDLLHAPATIWFQLLTDVQRYHFIGLLLLARQYGNRLPYDEAFLGRKLNATEPLDLDYFLVKGLIVPVKTTQPQSLQQGSAPSGAEGRQMAPPGAEARPSAPESAELCRSDGTDREGDTDSYRETHTHTHAPDGAENRVCVSARVSIHSWETCFAFAEHLRASGEGITNPGGFATAICTGDLAGQQDERITAWLAAPVKPKPKKLHDDPNCPRCQGYGQEYVGGDIGMQRCTAGD